MFACSSSSSRRRLGPPAFPGLAPEVSEASLSLGRSGRIRPCIALDHLGERRVSVSYEVHGPADARPVVVLGGISAGCHLAPAASDPRDGWWPGVVGKGRVLDPRCHRLIGLDYLGGETPGGDLLRPVTTRDQARALAAVLRELGTPRVALAGASYGGMVALAFAELFSERVSRLVVLCAAHRSHPMATAWRSLQRDLVDLGAKAGRTAEGLSLARSLAMTTYRSAEFEERFSSKPLAIAESRARGIASRPRFGVTDYLRARGADFVRGFDPERFLCLSESIDLHSTSPAALPPSALLVSVDTDVLVPPWLVERLVQEGGGFATHATLASPFGHDAFLKEVEFVSAFLRVGLGLERESVSVWTGSDAVPCPQGGVR